MDIIAAHGTTFLTIAVIFGLFMTWGIGANDVANATDHKAIDLLTELFAHEGEIDPVSLMIWHRLIRWVGDLANYSEKVGNRLRLLIAR